MQTDEAGFRLRYLEDLDTNKVASPNSDQELCKTNDMDINDANFAPITDSLEAAGFTVAVRRVQR